jgi:hypothetical protein
MLVVLLMGGRHIVYYEIQWKISRVEVVRHERLNDLIAGQIRAGGDFTNHPTRKRATVITDPGRLDAEGQERYYTRGLAGIPNFRTNEYRLLVTSFYLIHGQHYRVTTYSFIPSFYQLLPGWSILSMDLVAAADPGGYLGRTDLQIYPGPLQAHAAGDPVFDLKQKTAIRLPDTQTSEFRELNDSWKR